MHLSFNGKLFLFGARRALGKLSFVSNMLFISALTSLPTVKRMKQSVKSKDKRINQRLLAAVSNGVYYTLLSQSLRLSLSNKDM